MRVLGKLVVIIALYGVVGIAWVYCGLLYLRDGQVEDFAPGILLIAFVLHFGAERAPIMLSGTGVSDGFAWAAAPILALVGTALLMFGAWRVFVAVSP